MRPTIGRIVHIVNQGYDFGGQPMKPLSHQAAIIICVNSDGPCPTINCVQWDEFGNQSTAMGVKEDQTGQTQRTWHWPERVEESSGLRALSVPEIGERFLKEQNPG